MRPACSPTPWLTHPAPGPGKEASLFLFRHCTCSSVINNIWKCLFGGQSHKFRGPAHSPQPKVQSSAHDIVSSPVITWPSLGWVPAWAPRALSGPWQWSDPFPGLGGLSSFLERLPGGEDRCGDHSSRSSIKDTGSYKVSHPVGKFPPQPTPSAFCSPRALPIRNAHVT